MTNADNTYYCFGTAAGPHPFPTMVRDFQRVIGLEARVQIQDQAGRLPDAVTACVGGGSNAIGIFHAFLDDPGVRLVGFEAAGDGVETGRHAATFTGGSPGRVPGIVLVSVAGRGRADHRIALDLGGPGLSGRRPRARWLKDTGRAEYRPDHRHRGDGRVPAAVPHRRHHSGDRIGARGGRRAQAGREMGSGAIIVVNLSGRGDKDVETAAKWFGLLGQGTGHDVEQSEKSRLAALFSACRDEDRAALIGYLPTGYPDVRRRSTR